MGTNINKQRCKKNKRNRRIYKIKGEVHMNKEELNKSKQELKDYIYNKKWIDERLEDIKERRSLLDNITITLSDMPKRKC